MKSEYERRVQDVSEAVDDLIRQHWSKIEPAADDSDPDRYEVAGALPSGWVICIESRTMDADPVWYSSRIVPQGQSPNTTEGLLRAVSAH